MSRRGAMAAAVLAGSSAALLGAVGLAQAVWTSSGEGTPAAVVATLTSPTITKATPGAGAVELEWSASTAPGPGAVQYYVTGEGGTPGSGCPTAGAPSAVRSCTLSGVSIGSHHYTVTAVWRSWTSSSEARSVTVSFGAATHLLVEAANAEVNAGEADDLTVIAKDAANNTVLTYSGSHSLTFSGAASAPNGTSPTVTSESGPATGLGTATAIKFNEGKATVEGSKNGLLTLYRVEEAHIKVTEGELSNEGALVAVKVKPGPFKSFHVVATPAEPEAGQSFEAKITAWDEWHNVLTAYARTAGKKLLYSGAASSPSGTAPVYSATTEPTFTAGETTVTGFKFYDATTNTLKVEEETSANRGEASVKVKSVSGAAATKHWAWVHAEVTAGSITSPTCLFTCTATGVTVFNRFKARIAITDEWGNVASNVAGTNRAQVTLTGLGLLQNGAGIAIPTSGPAESTTTVELESLLFFGEGNLRVTTEAGLALTEATATVGF